MFTANKDIKLIYVHLFPDERCNMTNSIVRNPIKIIFGSNCYTQREFSTAGY